MPFRPWGNYQQILRAQENREWSYIGCASMEDRCVASCLHLSDYLGDAPKLVFRIEDLHSTESNTIRLKTDQNQQIFFDNNFAADDFEQVGIVSPFGSIDVLLRSFLSRPDVTNLILDITSLPKKVFFYVIRLILSNDFAIQNFVVTYAKPEKYNEAALAGNPEPWSALPGFRPSRGQMSHDQLVVGVGFDPLGLPKLVDTGEYEGKPITFFFPFPSQVDRASKNWRFIRSSFPNNSNLDIVSVDSSNLPEIFDRLCSKGVNGDVGLALAPYGPKPVSLGMAIYATVHKNRPCPPSVFYTQPTFYNPNYSEGILSINGSPQIDAYCVIIEGQSLYS